MEPTIEHRFARSRLPWLVAAGAILVYLFTLDRSVSLMNLTGLVRVFGWDWHPINQAPLFYALTLPIRWLPHSLQLAAANGFSLICAALTLALLARSVAILPHDRTREERFFEPHELGLLNLKSAWIAPLLAVLVCGLQLSFWELATAASGEMLDLLLFAYVIRCLLEYRLDRRESWLLKLAFVYGVGMANNWAMIGFFPAFLIAVIWTMGLDFLRYRFLGRAAACGLAGLSFYILLPLIQVSTDPASGSFLEALRANLGVQKFMLGQFRPYLVILLSLTSLMPILIISIRWPSAMGDISPAGFVMANLMITITYGALFLVCLYTAFDPVFSPRQLGVRSGTPLLTYSYASALAVGFFCGYFLLIFARHTGRPWARPSRTRLLINSALSLVVWGLALGVPAALAYRNLPQVQARHTPDLERYGVRLSESLPARDAVVLSDDPIRLHAVRAALGERVSQHVLIDTASLTQPAYHRYLKRTYGPRLPSAPALAVDAYPPATLVDFMEQIAAKHPICYLHPSFGYYFERFSLLPRGLVYDMMLCPTNSLGVFALPPDRLKAQDEYWSKLEAADLAGMTERVGKLTRRQRESAYNLQWTASFYSRACNHWGVTLQEAGQLDRAEHWYLEALKLNPENPCAFVNLEWCQHWKKTGKPLEKFSDEAMARLAPYAGNWDLLLSINGPLDEPTFRLELARVQSGNNQSRQAAAQLARVLAIDPKQASAQVLMGTLYVQANMPERALDLVSRLRADPALMGGESTQLGLVQVEAWAYYSQGNLARAETLLKSAQGKFAQDEGAYFTLAQIHLTQADRARAQGNRADYLQSMTNALAVFEMQMKAQPRNLPALVNYGGICAQLEDYPRAIAWLTRALEVDPNNFLARLNRAISELRSARYDEAKADYDFLLKLNPSAYRAYYGLAEIALHKQDWRSVMEHCEAYLKHAPAETGEYALVEKRLAEAKQKAKW